MAKKTLAQAQAEALEGFKQYLHCGKGALHLCWLNGLLARDKEWRGRDYLRANEIVYTDAPALIEELWVDVPHFTWGDYVGTSAERANFEVFCERYAARKGKDWHETRSGFNGHGIIIRLAALAGALGEVITDLFNYPVLCDEAVSDLEARLADESWRICYRSEFEDALHERLEGDELLGGQDAEDWLAAQGYGDAKARVFFEHCRAKAGQECFNEDADSMNIRVEVIAKSITAASVLDYFNTWPLMQLEAAGQLRLPYMFREASAA